MKLMDDVPCPNGTQRAQAAKELRDLCTEVARIRPHAVTRANGEEADYAEARFPSHFTKGLKHDVLGLLERPQHYRAFVEAINSENWNLFESDVQGAAPEGEPSPFRCEADFRSEGPGACCPLTDTETVPCETREPRWRGWESPRAGHVYELQGPDAGAVGMAPAPRVHSSELAAEMAEVYGLAILRDVPFSAIAGGGSKTRLCEKDGEAQLSGQEVVDLLNCMPFFSGDNPVSSTPMQATGGLNAFERNRRYARTLDDGAPYTAALTTANVFRGSTPGAQKGPYISQFMLVGGGIGGSCRDKPLYSLKDGLIPYGTLRIDQRTTTHKACLDYMTDWSSWLDVQNGADFRGTDRYEPQARFITTPRDLATYVHFDALYEAYLNAALILLGLGVPTSRGFPEPSLSGRRTGFATFGGPHILSLVTEVATRCLKAVRRQKFNYHRRARPEALGGRLTLAKCGKHEALGCAERAFKHVLDEIPDGLLKAVVGHNKEQNSDDVGKERLIHCKDPNWAPGADCNILLPMAFPEGSPMHPAYGAGHATVAGGCVTMVKAFFEMFEDCHGGRERYLCDPDGSPIVYVPDESAGSQTLTLDKAFIDQHCALTIQGELDKLAANIAIGRNMAGVHYYSDYYDSLRMGERVAVGILLEQAPTYGEAVEMTFTSFDGDFISITGHAHTAPTLTVLDRHGSPVPTRDWWLRHVPGEEVIFDLT